jgi:microcystin degradation protein MlrC
LVFARIGLARTACGCVAFERETAELEEGITRALAANESKVFLTDSGDNVTASTPGDLPVVLQHPVERKVKSAVVARLNDAAATAQCFQAGEGSKLRLSIGAHHREEDRSAARSRA